jgi:anti-sigma B factor antagonist
MLRVATHEVEGILVITCEAGESSLGDPRSAEREALYHMIEGRAVPRVAVDLGEIDYLASADIGFLISLKRRIDRRGGRLALFQVHPILFNILNTMRLSQFFTLAADLQDALRQLSHAS